MPVLKTGLKTETMYRPNSWRDRIVSIHEEVGLYCRPTPDILLWRIVVVGAQMDRLSQNRMVLLKSSPRLLATQRLWVGREKVCFR